MKKAILLLAGLVIMGGASLAQSHKGKGHSPKGNAYGHYKHREVIVERPSERVIISVSPGIRYVRTYTVAPRSYVYVNTYGRSYRSRVLSPSEIDGIAMEMDRLAMDRDRLSLAKGYIRKDMLYAEDVAFLMSGLAFEEHRLELAKFSYGRTVDQRNYHLVFDRLEYRGSQRELDRFIHGY